MENGSAASPTFFPGNFWSWSNGSLKFCTLRISISFQSWAKSQNCPIYLISFRNILLCGLKFSHITLHLTRKSLRWRLCFLLGNTILPYHTDRTKANFFQNKDRINKKMRKNAPLLLQWGSWSFKLVLLSCRIDSYWVMQDRLLSLCYCRFFSKPLREYSDL